MAFLRLTLTQLDRMSNPGLSKENLKRAKQVERERRRKRKARKKARSQLEAHEQD